MNFRIITLILLLVVTFGCRTIKESDFKKPDEDALSEFSNFEPVVDIENLKENISYGKVNVSGYYTGSLKLVEKFDSAYVLVIDESVRRKDVYADREKYQTEAIYVPEIRVYDMIKQFSKEFVHTSSNNSSDKNGSVYLKIISFKEKRNAALTFFSIWTLGIPALVGIPFSYIKTDLSIEVSIYNQKEKLIKSYLAEGNGIAYIAMYWGYGNDAWRKSSMNAFSDAMQEIKSQIKNDENSITP